MYINLHSVKTVEDIYMYAGKVEKSNMPVYVSNERNQLSRNNIKIKRRSSEDRDASVDIKLPHQHNMTELHKFSLLLSPCTQQILLYVLCLLHLP